MLTINYIYIGPNIKLQDDGMKWGKNKTASATKLCCVGESNTHMIMAVIDKTGNKPGFEQLVVTEKTAEADNLKILRQYVDAHHLQGEECAYILSPSNYRLFLIDKPNVPDTEVKNAARWLLRDLIDYPIDEAVVDMLDIPSPEQKPKLYLVVAKLAYLKDLQMLTESCGLRLQNIAITELAVNRLIPASLEQVSAVIYTEDKVVRMMLSKQGTVGMIREIGEIELLRTERWDRLILAIQRSFEFYQASLSGTKPNQFFLAPELASNTNLSNFLAEQLSMPVKGLQLPENITLPGETLPSLSLLSVIGETLQPHAEESNAEAKS
jgi:MSHA biogenesis protein MshI